MAFLSLSDSATLVVVNIFVRSFSNIDDVKMVRHKIRLLPYESKHSGFFARIQTNIHLPQAMSVAVILDL